MGVDTFTKHQRVQAIESVHRAMAQLQEFWTNVHISCTVIDPAGNTVSYDLDHDHDPDDDEDEKPSA